MVSHEPKFLSENLVIFPAVGKGPKYLFVFPRSRSAVVEEMVAYLRKRMSVPPSLEQRLVPSEV
jgi:hypothetical protein